LEPVKVVHLITLLEMGGAQGNTLYTVEHLSPVQFETHLWAGHGAYWDRFATEHPRLSPRLRFFSNLVRPLNPFRDAVAILQLWRALKQTKPRILHTHSSKAGILGRIAARLAGVPIVIHTFHGFGFNDQQAPWTRAFFIWLERRIAPLAAKLIFVSQSNLEEARELGIGVPAQHMLIRSGVPLAAIAKIAQQTDRLVVRAKLGIKPDAKLITTIGPFKPQKNLVDFIRMGSAVAAKLPQAHFLMIGDGAQREILQRLALELRIADRLSMPGWREDIVALLAASDAFVLTSLWEGLPRSLVEALQVGVPCFCYATDGVRDLYGPSDPNVVNRKDWGKLADRIVATLLDPVETAQQVARDRAKITLDFDIDVMVNQQERLYQCLLTPEKWTTPIEITKIRPH
jgi:glycosyltransferase involved in cell wall biosynthesis